MMYNFICLETDAYDDSPKIAMCMIAMVIVMWPQAKKVFTTERPFFEVKRLPNNPIIHADMDARMAEEMRRMGYININGLHS